MDTEQLENSILVKDGKGNITAVLVLHYDMHFEVGIFKKNILSLLVVSLIAILLFVAGGYWFAKRMARNLQSVTVAAQRIAAGDYSSRLSLTTKDEFLLLENSFNELAAKVESNIAEISRKNEHLDMMAKRQAMFTSNASHELKTPLTGILGNAETIVNYVDNLADAKLLAKNIYADGERLAKLTENLLKLARLESEELKSQISFVPINIAQVAIEAANSCSNVWKSKQQQLALAVTPDIVIDTEPELFRQVVTNLVDNAMKYSAVESIIEVTLAVADEQIILRVKDNGPGLAEQDMLRIFDRFYRVDKARSQAIAGSGLGLAITRQIVDALGGAIRVESELGNGSVFIVAFPGTSANKTVFVPDAYKISC
ncbi:MAG: HAMP domain-containing sensor histidine kinase [Bacillota bacterium]